jgi:hypothetical protein
MITGLEFILLVCVAAAVFFGLCALMTYLEQH